MSFEDIFMDTDEKKQSRGGKREGSGRPKGSVQGTHSTVEQDMTMLELLRQVALGRIKIDALQLKAAQAALPYEAAKPADLGKKETLQQEAESIAEMFPTIATPLRAVK
jgi:hypothetical protein